jgi:hypothetical protein
MLRFLSDENFRAAIVRGLRARDRDIDIVRVQDSGLSGMPDQDVLAWAADNGRVLLTHDAKTVPPVAFGRVSAGLAMPGVFEIDVDAALGRVIDDIVLLARASFEGEWEGQVLYLPLR